MHKGELTHYALESWRPWVETFGEGEFAVTVSIAILRVRNSCFCFPVTYSLLL